MACGCTKKTRAYRWTSEPDPDTQAVTVVEKRTEVEAKALVIRHGGTYEALPAK